MTGIEHLDPDEAANVRDKQRAAGRSVWAGLTLTAIKLAAGLASGSLGLLAEAAHSALDLVAAAMTWFAVRTSWRPPDEEHPYGHGKIENLTALGETLLLVLTSCWILWEASRRIRRGGTEVDPSVWAFSVMGLSIVVDVLRSRDLRRVARRSGSQALEADALHFTTDIASSAVVVAGLLGVLVARHAGIPWLTLADPVAASFVALIVLALSWRLGRRAADMLLDRAPSRLTARAVAALGGLEGLEESPRVRLRQSGDRVFADVELSVRRGVPLAEAERIAEAARERVRAAVGSNAAVTVELKARQDVGEPLRQKVATAVAMEGVQGHNITIRGEPPSAHADLHLELPGSMSLGEGHAIADRVEARILHEVAEVRRVDIHLELHDETPESAGTLDEASRRDLETRVLSVARSVAGEGSVHDVMLARAANGVYLSCHCFVPADTSLAAAHELTDRLEHAFRDAVPELTRVAVHAEPYGSRRLTAERSVPPS
ncbi:MAG: cation-efflux pump [Acidobacteriia bacterium]|nr:cation-efflux pump [Terriglobia bacterium]